MTVNQDVLDAAYAEARAVAEAMSLLDSPVPRSSIEALGIPLLKLPRLESLAVSTGGEEVVLAASAARFFRSKLNASSTAEAHRACLFILGHASFSGRLTVVLREQRLTHSLGAHESAAAVAEAEALLWKYRQLDRPLAVVSLIQRIGALWRELPEDVLIVPAWAYTVLADLTQAKFWLDRASPSEPLERAWQHGLKAEIHKAEGQKQAALDEINSAIEQLATVPREQFTPLMARRLRAYRQDRARILQYLFYDLAHATDEYAQLLSEWQNDDDAAIDVAIVLRNYSECVRTGHAVGGREWQQGKDMVERATRMMQERQDHPVFAEIAYEQARIAIAEHSPEAAAVLESASIVAAKSGHLMLVAICAARHFWELEDFDVARWRDIESGLVAFPRHGWAVRTLINGRLRAAKRVADKTLVREWMAKNLQALRENPAFNAGSDRFRIAASFAGYSLALTGGDADRKWQEFLQIEWAAVWLSENGSTSAQDVWGRA
jgi:tetratricopeptide (TPR) repeat protein